MDWKERGNELFRQKDFAGAARCYSDAIAAAHEGDDAYVYYGNRAACHSGLENWAQAVKDARRSVELCPSYAKGHYRIAQALLALGQRDEAAEAASAGLAQDPANTALARLLAQAKATNAPLEPQEQQQQQRRQQQSTVHKRPGKAKLVLGAGLYDDMLGSDGRASSANGLTTDGESRAVFRRLRESVAAGGAPAALTGDERGPHVLEGAFARLLQPSAFQETVFPGLSQEQRKSAPQSFQALLADEAYSAELEASVPRALAKARSVLDAVKRKGAAAGETMDEATERALEPQVLQEAFAREVVAAVRAVHARAHAEAAAKAAPADPHAEEATWEQVQPVAIAALADGPGWALQDVFLGASWPNLLADDARRLAAAGRLQPLPVLAGSEGKKGGSSSDDFGDLAWIEPAELDDAYPAMRELVTALHALPFELNRNCGGKLPPLRAPQPGSTALVRLRDGCRTPWRLDTKASGEDTGHSVTCLYFVDGRGDGSGGGQLRLSRQLPTADQPFRANEKEEKGVQGAEVEPQADRLVLFRSADWWNERLRVSGEAQFAVLFWLHGSAQSSHGEATA